MATFTFQSPAAETFTGGAENDLFVGSNNFFGAGDRAFGGAGIDEFLYFADTSVAVDGTAKAIPSGFGNNNSGAIGAGGPTKTISAFQLSAVEVVTVTNDSGSTLIFDMSNANGVTDLVSANSSDGVIFDQVTELANVRLANQTFSASADVGVGFQAAVLAGANDTVALVLQNTQADTVRIGQSSATLGSIGNTGVENVNLTVIGNVNSTIQTLDTQLTRLTILDDAASTGGVTIVNTLAGTVRAVTNQSDGSATINASGATGAVTFTGASGNENFTGGAFNDTFNLGDGNNTARTGGGINTVNTGSGTDVVFAQGSVDTVNTGAGNDSIVDNTTSRLVLNAGDGSDSYIGILPGEFNASANIAGGAQFDSLNMGAGYDVLFIAAGATDSQFAQVTSAEAVAFATAGTTGLGAIAQAAGVNAIFLGSGSAGNDVVDASNFTVGLSVISSGSDAGGTGAALANFLTTQAGRVARFGAIDSTGGGDDTVTTGNQVDYFLFRGDNALTSADQLSAGAQFNAGGAVAGDTLVLEGDTTLTGAGAFNGFRQFEVVLLESAVGSLNRTQTLGAAFGNQYNLTIVDANAPSTGPLFINGSNLKAAVAGTSGNAAETVVINASAVTAFALDITTGNAADVITLSNSNLAARVVTQGGDDIVNDGTGLSNDIIDVGLGNDTVNLVNGNNTVFAEGGNNRINAGAGADTVFTGGGSDIVVFEAGELTAADTLADRGGLDAIQTVSGTADGAFAGINSGNLANSRYEVLFLSGAGTTTLGANAARAGFTTIVGDGADQVINLNNANFAKGMRVDLSAGGNDTVNLGNVTALAAPALNAPTPAGFFDFIESPVNGFNWAPPAGGYGDADTTANANLVIAGTGNQTVNGGTGSDVVRINNAEWDGADVFAGGAGYDAIQFDLNGSAGGVNSLTATINLTNVTNVELFQSFGTGDRLPTVDADTYTVTFTGGNVNTLTQLKLDNSSMNDANDVMRYIIGTGQTDADFAFNIFGAAAGTTLVDKQNTGVNNNINFQGGAGVDVLRISGGDLGSTTVFNGGAGTQDAIIQAGGQITDDDFFQVTNVEILTADVTVSPLNAFLGDAASRSGLTTIQGTTGNDQVTFDPAFFANVQVILSGGDDNFNATGAIGTITYNENLANLTAADRIIGGANGADTFNINATVTPPQTVVAGNLTNVDGIERYNITATGGTTVDLTLGTIGGNPSLVNGAQTFTFINATPGDITVLVRGANENANTVINTGGGADQITLGSGNDTINTGAGNDSIYTGNGTNSVNAGDGNDQVTGGMGNDTIDGGAGNDQLRGMGGNDTILGGAGDDIIYGGAGGDIMDGGAGADQYLYRTNGNSESTFGARDTVTVGAGDRFVFDNAGAVGTSVNFVGTQANFQDAQSATIAGDGILQAVYQADQGILWVDINDDGALNANDLQILIRLEAGVTLDGTFFANNNGGIAAFEAGFTGPLV